jgi:hypothetical protein
LKKQDGRNEEVQGSNRLDFPGIDGQRSDEWKQATQSANIYTAVLLAALVLLNLILYLTTGSIMLGGVVLLVIFVFIWRKPRRLEKELGMTRQKIKEARMRSSTSIDS